MMSGDYGDVKFQDAGKEGGEQRPPASPPSVSPSSPDRSSSIAITGTDYSKQRGNKSRSKPGGRDERTGCGRTASDWPPRGSAAPAVINLNNPGTLRVKGTGKILQGKAEANGNCVAPQASKNMQEISRREDGFTRSRRRRPVTVDTSKAKTSLEALKLSIKQLKWKEVCCLQVTSTHTHTNIHISM